MYGRLLAANVALVAVALAAAWMSRSQLRCTSELWASVRAEAAITLGALALTAVLAPTSPPAPAASSKDRRCPPPRHPQHQMDLSEGPKSPPAP